MNEIIIKDASGALQKIYTPPAGEIMLFAGDAVPTADENRPRP